MTALGSNYLLTMPLIENHQYDNNLPYSFGHPTYDDFTDPTTYVKSEVYVQPKQLPLLPPPATQSSQVTTTFTEPSYCAFQTDTLEHQQDTRSDTRTSTPQLKIEEVPSLDSDTSAESSPLNVGPGDLDLLPQQQPHLGYYQQTYGAEDDTASETSFGTETSPHLSSADYGLALTGENISQWPSSYYDMINQTQQASTSFQQQQQQQSNPVQQSGDQMRFIIYEHEGTGLVPTLSTGNSAVMWPATTTTSLAAPAAADPGPSRAGGVMPAVSTMQYFTAQQQTQPASLDATQPKIAGPSGHQPQMIRCPHEGCTKTFSRLYNLKAHLRSHSPARPFQCPMCSRSFSRKHDLQRHIRVHTGAKPYVCPCCSKAFARTDALRRHFKMEETCRNSPEVLNMKTRRRYSDHV